MKRLRRFLKTGVVIMLGVFGIPALMPVFIAPVREPAVANTTVERPAPQERVFRGDTNVAARVYTGKDGVNAEIVQVKKRSDADFFAKMRIKPKTLGEVLNPLCIGQPQKCREEPAPQQRPVQESRAEPVYKRTITWQCRDPRTIGDNTAPKTWTFEAATQADADSKAMEAVQSGADLCKMYDPMKISDRTMVPGSAAVLHAG